MTLNLKKWFSTKRIEVILWDLDDTLLDTYKLFLQQLLQQANDSTYHDFSVNPQKWKEVAKIMAQGLSSDEKNFFDGLPILEAIYETAPEFLTGAKTALRVLKKTGLPMGLVTHANESWTQIKVDQRGLKSFFDQIMIISEDKFKDSADWRKAIKRFDVNPENVLVLGDNLTGDIQAAHSIGVKNIVYFPSPWAIYSVGKVPQGVISIDGGVKDLITTLASIS